MNEEIIKYLKENLRIEIDTRFPGIYRTGGYLKVKLLLEDETISSDEISLSSLQE